MYSLSSTSTSPWHAGKKTFSLRTLLLVNTEKELRRNQIEKHYVWNISLITSVKYIRLRTYILYMYKYTYIHVYHRSHYVLFKTFSLSWPLVPFLIALRWIQKVYSNFAHLKLVLELNGGEKDESHPEDNPQRQQVAQPNRRPTLEWDARKILLWLFAHISRMSQLSIIIITVILIKFKRSKKKWIDSVHGKIQTSFLHACQLL